MQSDTGTKSYTLVVKGTRENGVVNIVPDKKSVDKLALVKM
jgi:hypothetical protein